MSTITFSTCWYPFKAKFDATVYHSWLHTMLSNVHQYYLVIYTEESSRDIFQPYEENPRIKIILKPYTEFYYYQYKDQWIKNHEQNPLLNTRVDWRVNMLWSEKTCFVYETMQKQYFNTDFYGWCDIGYFRARPYQDIILSQLASWPNPAKLASLSHEKVYYACVNNDAHYIQQLFRLIQEKDVHGLPKTSIPPHQVSIAGGFFLCHKSQVEDWKTTYEKKLSLYFQHDRLVKDDQIIVADCVFSHLAKFSLCKEENLQYDNWFLFQRFLL